MTKIAIIDDERDILHVLEFNLKSSGYEVVTAENGRDGLRAVQQHKPDLVILDLMLPDISGTEVCRLLRESPEGRNLPILMVSAKGEEIDRVVGFELGADDYVTKPFSVRELGLRIRALLRRSKPAVSQKRTQHIEFGVLRIDREAHRVWVEEEEVVLTALEFKLLTTLHERKNRVQSRGALLEHVWGMHAHISTRTVDAHVKRLREKLAGARDYVETVRGVGYRFKESPDAPSDSSEFGDDEEPLVDYASRVSA